MADDKNVLVTGATGLLGRQVVKAFGKKDWNARGTGFSRADGATILKVDLASASEVERALDNIKYVFGPRNAVNTLMLTGLQASRLGTLRCKPIPRQGR